MKKKLLLHICCAPCVVYVWEKLLKEYEVTGFFYNPNIHPGQEYEFRKGEMERIAKKFNWKVFYPPYEPDKWFEKIKGYEDEPERGKRCILCFGQGLRKLFVFAAQNDFDLCASTLSISPYKVTAQINSAGEELAKEFKLKFLGENFKKQGGYNIGRKLALDLGIKHQNYCGCIFSQREKQNKLRSKKDI